MILKDNYLWSIKVPTKFCKKWKPQTRELPREPKTYYFFSNKFTSIYLKQILSLINSIKKIQSMHFITNKSSFPFFYLNRNMLRFCKDIITAAYVYRVQ